MLRTALCDRLGVTHPIVQAPIGPAAGPELAAAVADAGGVGMLSVTWESAEEAERLVTETLDRTDGVVGVNIVLEEQTAVTDPATQVTTCIEAGVDLFSFAWGDARPFADRIHAADGTVMQTVGSADAARAAVDGGADIVVAQGWEAGGHVQSEVATLPLIPRVADAVNVPVIAAGGIADGRGVAAVLTLGAAGAWLGTRFVATEEARTHEQYRQSVTDASETDTVASTVFDVGWPEATHRVLTNSTVAAWEAAGRPPPGDRPNEGEVVAEMADGMELPRYSIAMPMPGMQGSLEALALYAGQSAGLTEAVAPASAVVTDLVSEAESAIRRTRDCIV